MVVVVFGSKENPALKSLQSSHEKNKGLSSDHLVSTNNGRPTKTTRKHINDVDSKNSIELDKEAYVIKALKRGELNTVYNNLFQKRNPNVTRPPIFSPDVKLRET